MKPALLTLIALTLHCAVPASADPLDRGDNHSVGSEYSPSDFLDTHFEPGQDVLRGLLDAASRRDAWDRQHPDDSRIYDLRRHIPDDREFQIDKVQPVANNLLDWVPGDFDPLNNGGFTLAPFNGSPVPYRLNGHLNAERGYPWQKDSD
jgi:hypothetical protein